MFKSNEKVVCVDSLICGPGKYDLKINNTYTCYYYHKNSSRMVLKEFPAFWYDDRFFVSVKELRKKKIETIYVNR